MTPQDGWKQEADDLDAVLRLIGLDPQACRTDGGSLNIGRVRAAVEASARQLAEQPGFVMVPEVPTSNMLAAMSGEWHSSRHDNARKQYAAALAARPLTASPTAPSTEASARQLAEQPGHLLIAAERWAQLEHMWSRNATPETIASYIGRPEILDRISKIRREHEAAVQGNAA